MVFTGLSWVPFMELTKSYTGKLLCLRKVRGKIAIHLNLWHLHLVVRCINVCKLYVNVLLSLGHDLQVILKFHTCYYTQHKRTLKFVLCDHF